MRYVASPLTIAQGPNQKERIHTETIESSLSTSSPSTTESPTATSSWTSTASRRSTSTESSASTTPRSPTSSAASWRTSAAPCSSSSTRLIRLSESFQRQELLRVDVHLVTGLE
uniref:Uncharacterized protein n=1 Tax=Guillardia theta TaxID=55529 RepID=A0A7S4KS48_GUITH